ncbi:acyltransferase family protein [Exiguobacterium artemiae]
MGNKYFSGIDSFKGILIVLVIVGHIILGSTEENLARYTIYKFHMPLFLAITGYLITFKSIKLWSFSNLFEKYFYRMLLPWILAFVFFYVIRNFKHIISGDLTFKNLMLSLLYPYYHLWYIPSVFIMVIFIWLLIRLKLSLKLTLFSSAMFTIIWLATNENGQNDSNIVFTIMGDKRTYYFFVYLLIGFYLRNMKYTQIAKKIALQ